jgi:hypothetical protein
MSEGHLPLDGTPDAFEPLTSEIVATQKTPTVSAGGRKRLATLGGAFLVLMAIVGYLYWSMLHDQHTTAQIQEEMKKEGVQLIFSKSEPKEASFSPFQQLNPTVKIMAPAGNITDVLLKRIGDINLDMDLMLNNCPVSDDGLVVLEGKQNIRWLELRKTKVTDAGIKHLRGTHLELLDLSTTKIGDDGLATLSELDFPYLETLALEGLPNVTDKGISQLTGFKSLEFLSVAGTKVTRKGTDHLRSKLPGLTILGAP